MFLWTFGWNDIGAWSSLWDIKDKNADGNVTNGDIWVHDTQHCFIHSDATLVAAVGVENLVIVVTQDSVLVADRSKVQDVKKIVERLKLDQRNEVSTHRKVFRPWGHFDSVDTNDRYQVKRITVNPGAKLSVQMHHHRAEHWIVVSGTADITVAGKSRLLTENESIYIPLGSVHSLANPGKIPLELIEVQSGSYLGEDDIVRFDDQYGRCN